MTAVATLALAAAIPFAAPVAPAQALDNGVAKTPPMGWNSWNAYRCDVNETKIKAAADAIVSLGLREAGYTYVNVDDCWQQTTRTADGALTGDPTRFPSGMKALGDYIHSKGLKFGIYATPGTVTCAQIYDNYPGQLGSKGHEVQDANTFASWGVDYLKYDWCNAGVDRQAAFTTMGNALKATGRPILYSIHDEPELPMQSWRPAISNAWRTTVDIRSNWPSITSILDDQVGLEAYSKPGAWNDPDMLQVGNGSLTVDENKSHFALWALLNAPLLMGNELQTMSSATAAILENRDLIAVNQDWGGQQGTKISDTGDLEIWRKPMSDGSFAVGLFNRSGSATSMTATTAQLGFSGATSLSAKDLWTGTTSSVGAQGITVQVPSHGIAVYRVQAAAAPAGPLTAGTTVTATAAHSSKVVDVPNGTSVAGTQLVQFRANGGTNQRFTVTGDATAGYRLQSVASGLCIDAADSSKTDGGKVVQWTCHGNANQRWKPVASGSGWALVNVATGLCLDVPAASTADGVGLQQWRCNQGANQRWSFPRS